MQARSIRKSLLLWAFVVPAVAVALIYPNFPANFSSTITSTEEGLTLSEVYVSRWVDAKGKHQYKAFINQTGQYIADGMYVLMTDPPGALPGSLRDKGRLSIQLGKRCQYTGRNTFLTGYPVGFAEMMGFASDDYTCVGYYVCPGMKYLGSKKFWSYAVDVWYTKMQTVVSAQPDNVTVLAHSETGIPVWAGHYHPGKSGTFNPTEDLITEMDLTPGEPRIDIDSLLPKNWMKNCTNLDVGTGSNTDREFFYTTPDSSDNMTFFLTYPPAWDNVTV